MSHLRLGDSLDKNIDMGAVVDKSQWESIDSYVRKARAEGNDVRGRYLFFESSLLKELVSKHKFPYSAPPFLRKTFSLF